MTAIELAALTEVVAVQRDLMNAQCKELEQQGYSQASIRMVVKPPQDYKALRNELARRKKVSP